MSNANASGTGSKIPHAPTEAQVRHYNEVLTSLPGKPRMRVTDWISTFLGYYDSQPEGQESIAREMHEFLDFYLQSRNLNRGVLILPEIQEALIEEGRTAALRDSSKTTGQSYEAAQAPEAAEKAQETNKEAAAHLEIPGQGDTSATNTLTGDKQRSVGPTLNKSSILSGINSSNDPTQTRHAPKRKAAAAEEISLNTITSSIKKHTANKVDSYEDMRKATYRDRNAKAYSIRKTRQTPGFAKLTKAEQQKKLDEEWTLVKKERYDDGVSYEALMDKYVSGAGGAGLKNGEDEDEEDEER